MPNKETKLVFKNWRSFLAEQEAPTADAVTAVDKMMKLPYARFAETFKTAASNPKVLAVIRAGLNDAAPKEDDQITVLNGVGIPVIGLKPTQNEVLFGQSLGGPHGPLQKPELLEKMLIGGDVVVPPKPEATPYAVTAERKYIVDGHHRWSSLFCINPKANIVCIDLAFKTPLNPLTYLKITQMAIAADKGAITSAAGASASGGINLFKIDQNLIKSQVPKEIEAGPDKEKIMEIFAKHGHKDINAITDLIWTNIQQLQKIKPVAGAPIRDVMPQTDPSKGFADKLKAGMVNFAHIKKTPTTDQQKTVKENLFIENLANILFEELNKK